MTNTEEPLDPAGMLALATSQQRSVSASRGSFVALIMAGWGVALLAGFLVLYSVHGWIGTAIFVALIVAACIFSTVLGVRGARGIRTKDAFTGTAYGISWSLAMAGLGVLGGGLITQGLHGGLLLLFYSSLYTFLIGTQFFMAGVLWRAKTSLVVGSWLVLVAIVSPYLGYPGNYLLLGIAGGGGFIVLAIVTAVRARSAKSASNG